MKNGIVCFQEEELLELLNSMKFVWIFEATTCRLCSEGTLATLSGPNVELPAAAEAQIPCESFTENESEAIFNFIKESYQTISTVYTLHIFLLRQLKRVDSEL